MYDNETPSEKHPLRFAFAFLAAMMVNGAIGASMLSSGVDDRLRRDGAQPLLIADLGTLPAVTVQACRVKA